MWESYKVVDSEGIAQAIHLKVLVTRVKLSLRCLPLELNPRAANVHEVGLGSSGSLSSSTQAL